MFDEKSPTETIAGYAISALGIVSAIISVATYVSKQPAMLTWVLGVCAFVFGLTAFVLLRQHVYIGFDPKQPNKLVRIAAHLLDRSRESVHYFGAIGMINTEDEPSWQNSLHRKLVDPKFRVLRMIQMLEPEQLDVMFGGDVANKQHYIGQYHKWLQLHLQSGQWGEMSHTNAVIHVPCGPIWQHGLHFIIFDRKHVLFVYRKDQQARGFLMRYRSRLALDLIEMMESAKLHYGKFPETQADLLRRVEALERYMAEHHIQELRGVFPFRKTFASDITNDSSNDAIPGEI